MELTYGKTITRLMRGAAGGDIAARDRLYALLYDDLREISRRHLSRAGTISLDPSAVLHDCFLRMETGASKGEIPDRAAFLGYASTVMRSVIVDYVRERGAQKRGSGLANVTLDTDLADTLITERGVVGVDEALKDLARVNRRCHRVVELRYFGGLTEEETAAVLGLSAETVKRDWRKARAFLLAHFQDDP